MHWSSAGGTFGDVGVTLRFVVAYGAVLVCLLMLGGLRLGLWCYVFVDYLWARCVE